MKWCLSYLALLAVCPLLGCSSDVNGQTSSAPETVASTSLCGDSYVQAFAPDHISALSWQAGSALSLASEAQADLPQIDASPERVFSQKDALILFGPGEGLALSPILPHSLTLNWAEDFEGVSENGRALLKALNIKTDPIAAWEARLERLRDAQTGHTPPKILYLTPAGGSAGPNTFVDAVIGVAGGQNVNLTAGWHSLDMETLLHYKPDIIVMSFMDSPYHSRSHALSPVLQNYLAQYKVVILPGRYWPCAGPYLLDAAEDLQKEIKRWQATPKADAADV